MKQTIDSLERQELRDLGFFGSMMSVEKQLLEYLPLDKLESFESLRGPGEKEWVNIDDFAEEDSLIYSMFNDDFQPIADDFVPFEDQFDDISFEDIKKDKKIDYCFLGHIYRSHKKNIELRLRSVMSIDGLQVIANDAISFDKKMHIAGLTTVNTLLSLEGLVLTAKARIKRLNWVELPATMQKGKAMAVAYSMYDYKRYKAQGYCVLILPIRKEVKV